MKPLAVLGAVVLLLSANAALAQASAPLAAARPIAAVAPAPALAGVAYASAAGAGEGHLLDLYLPSKTAKPTPLVIFSHGSAWLSNNGRSEAQLVAAQFNPAGYAVAGVAIRASDQGRFPAQVHDIKAAIRWLRANASTYNLDPARIGIMGESSGGWAAAMAATTGDAPELEGQVGVTGVSSAVQAAVAFYPPTNFLAMDAWAVEPCDPKAPPTGRRLCHDGPGSPESLLIGCPIQTCPDKALLANPARYVTPVDPPIMVVHGEADLLVPYNQGALLYQSLSMACHEAVFVSAPLMGHGAWSALLTNSRVSAGATIRSTKAQGCRASFPRLMTPTWQTLIDFFDVSMKVEPRP